MKKCCSKIYQTANVISMRISLILDKESAFHIYRHLGAQHLMKRYNYFSAFLVNDSHCSAPSSSPHSSPVDASMLTDFNSGELNNAIQTYSRCKKLKFFLISGFSLITAKISYKNNKSSNKRSIYMF